MIRLYGHDTLGSFGVVTKGVRQGLEELGKLSGFVPVNAMQQDSYPGADAQVSINAGAPLQIGAAHVSGFHDRHLSVLAVNSEGIPEDLRIKLSGEIYSPARKKRVPLVDKFLATSTWCKEVLEREFPDHEVGLYLHGVQSHFKVLPEARKLVRETHDKMFRVLHVTSTRTRRKGTYELFRAWKYLKLKGELNLIVHPTLVHFMREHVDKEGVPNVNVMAGLSIPDEVMFHGMSHMHVVCQPSRAEGFGLVPLEARACGVPVVATDCTGHRDHVHGPGVQVVKTGPLEDIDDFVGAKAPRLVWESVADALMTAHDRWKELDEEAEMNASVIQEQWSWKNVTKDMIDREV